MAFRMSDALRESLIRYAKERAREMGEEEPEVILHERAAALEYRILMRGTQFSENKLPRGFSYKMEPPELKHTFKSNGYIDLDKRASNYRSIISQLRFAENAVKPPIKGICKEII
jgi:hypothetical protein